MKAKRSNICTSASFLSSAPYRGGKAFFELLSLNISGDISSASSNFIQSNNSDVEGFFFIPATSLNSKKTLKPSL